MRYFVLKWEKLLEELKFRNFNYDFFWGVRVGLGFISIENNFLLFYIIFF